MGNPKVLYLSSSETLTLKHALEIHKARLQTDPYYANIGFVRDGELEDVIRIIKRLGEN